MARVNMDKLEQFRKHPIYRALNKALTDHVTQCEDAIMWRNNQEAPTTMEGIAYLRGKLAWLDVLVQELSDITTKIKDRITNNISDDVELPE